MASDNDINRWIRQFLRAELPRSKSLMVTILGDSIAPRVRGLWLSELIHLLRPFQVNERLVRTSTFRLAEEGWLEPRREGRRSRYSLTDSGLQRIENAYPRIYNPPPRAWDGAWTVVILRSGVNRVAERAELRRELEWEGFGHLAPGIALHPCADRAALRAILQRLQLAHSAIVLQARASKEFTALPSNVLLEECWKIDELAALYAKFLTRFRPLLPLIGAEINPQNAFVLQTLLIHSFRRVALHDPRFPVELLPRSWPGLAAYELARSIHLRTYRRADQYLAELLEEPKNRAANPKIAERFGGLTRS